MLCHPLQPITTSISPKERESKHGGTRTHLKVVVTVSLPLMFHWRVGFPFPAVNGWEMWPSHLSYNPIILQVECRFWWTASNLYYTLFPVSVINCTAVITLVYVAWCTWARGVSLYIPRNETAAFSGTSSILLATAKSFRK